MCGDVDRIGKNRARDVPNPVAGDPWITPRCTIEVVPRPPFVAATLIPFDYQLIEIVADYESVFVVLQEIATKLHAWVAQLFKPRPHSCAFLLTGQV
jgi:hypothetical protein